MPAALPAVPAATARRRYGPPPAYPRLKLPGVNCPIPSGAKWGFGDGTSGVMNCHRNSRTHC
jgi:splicing factor 3B subunit 2